MDNQSLFRSSPLWTFEDEPIDRDFFASRIAAAETMRKSLGLSIDLPDAQTNAFRLVNAESDLLPGLIVDYFNGFLVTQFLTL